MYALLVVFIELSLGFKPGCTSEGICAQLIGSSKEVQKGRGNEIKKVK
jgi:hypothetical protein